MTDTSKYLSPLVSCLTCRKEYSAKGIFTHFISSHTEEGKERHKMNGKNFAQLGANINKQKAIERKLNYSKNPNICICGSPKSYKSRNSKYCSQSCAATNTNKTRTESGWSLSAESRIKIGYGVTKTVISNNETILKDYKNVEINRETKSLYTPIHLCNNCNHYFYRPLTSGKQNCSAECTHDIRSRKARNNPGLGTKRSKQEIELYSLCCDEFSNVDSNIKLVDGWDADIVLQDEKVAILWNGPWHYKEMNIGNHSLKQVQNRDLIKTKLFLENGWSVEVFEDRYYSPQTAIETLKLKYKMV